MAAKCGKDVYGPALVNGYRILAEQRIIYYPPTASVPRHLISFSSYSWLLTTMRDSLVILSIIALLVALRGTLPLLRSLLCLGDASYVLFLGDVLRVSRLLNIFLGAYDAVTPLRVGDLQTFLTFCLFSVTAAPCDYLSLTCFIVTAYEGLSLLALLIHKHLLWLPPDIKIIPIEYSGYVRSVVDPLNTHRPMVYFNRLNV
ncbi:uncharacterized protein BT62DRAFT_1009153 [Guyanagaster necrorhizus]|uniref:Uncharacterized protein n=1 Tax=Guyanagaster necrorhizus TaxID=856835 RepID=A0A9P8APV2_9AGAR|nr:uncharacterized protein BT62DRAFT_1009153 [Guyanagaster necrorhizus MCA 3950]KAG7443360.1 hypothetical protein BT62DRAFT_1009153 [Guyanagaster necrorhizus MCA 3950]